MAALARRELEAAKLKDQNVALSQEVSKLSSHVNTSMKFNARIFKEQTSSERAMQEALKEVYNLKTEKKLLERRIKEEEALRKLSEEKLKTIQDDFNVRLRTLENTIKEKEDFFSDELVAIRNDHRNEIEEIISNKNYNDADNNNNNNNKYGTTKQQTTTSQQYKSNNNHSPLKHKVLDLENEILACNNLLKKHEERHKKSGARLQESLKSLEEYRSKVNENEIEKNNLLREINIKDKQLKKLRTDLEFSGNNEDNNFGYNANNKNNDNKEEMDDAIEFMKEEMLAMKSTYENQIQKLKDEIDTLNRQRRRKE